MIGVVLWSDETLNKAVIWCDDQGDLAFYTNKDAEAGFQELNAGDWVEFDVTVSGNFRIAENLVVLMEKGSPDLAGRLSAAAGCAAGTSSEDANGGTVIPFPVREASKRNAAAALQAGRR